MDLIKRYPIVALAVAFGLGFFIGLVLFGWSLTPVVWTDAGPQDLTASYQEMYLRNVADLYSHDLNQQRVKDALAIWPEANVKICQMAQTTTNPGEAARLEAIAAINNETGCAGVNTAAPAGAAPADGGGSNLALICVISLLLLLVVAGIILLLMRRNSAPATTTYETYEDEGYAEEGEEEEGGSRAIARFNTTYIRGDDSYDDSFPVENASGEFLGECGVGISESIGADSPRSVTAFEVWLFDKNDIRTVTKVAMSDYAFFDEGIKAKLSPKGEPVLARQNETVVLETASLIINADIVELDYGADPSLPENSYFERFTIELSAWTKDGEGADMAMSGGVDDSLAF